ncbi:FAD:protein FMN transferase [Chlamydia muridarum str. Nigg]|jgi:Membrane-associated lipoprotein involved in thiamine biosynthesis|uniref:FAD:protein FMN transferase n=2 Tax=Chlamydia muridarum TaxID=83560 RepID=APBE_CHLMU|nr:FAD:protein FMN transferase [Chlamydia muridarum]Q9PKW2.2 RecName: Full=FAD:protein FMN transferase; AltName: Full=Flavin transferase; Flags: Precursor [Chlamydia muridarum str. Nigg]AHH22740.1 thiamine biosynthesis protein ApbE [Chlamydia muridarum str. Nigg3 CMUT3-5]AHH23665.1 thiamine biosynthesis protein ApbE [Chlamydia muridarum str. Nigg CM972]AID37880.1 thiamine biosynthesis protein ApbE [Chlamydia muridarum str. Nigg 2 MCR]AIT90548.1 thiamine biosynthesis protein ApbE [Chlamydia mur
MGKFFTPYALIIFVFLIQACSSPSKTIFEGVRMTIPYRVVLGETLSFSQKKQAQKEIDQIFDHIDQIFNNWNPFSEISRINRSETLEPISLSPELFSFLCEIDRFHTFSDGRFDPTLGALKNLWLLHLKSQTLPPQELLHSYKQNTGWHLLSLDKTNHTLKKLSPSVQLDLCGAVKGFAVDLLGIFCSQFCQNYYVEWGGEIKTSGKHPSGRSWAIASSATPEILHLNNSSIATSGNQYQRWYVNKKIYTHILDPLTGIPLEESSYPILAVSVIDENCAFADAMATALTTFTSKQEALDWAKKKHLCVYITDKNAS